MAKTKKTKKPKALDNTFIVWRGISALDNETPIVVLATLRSANEKTGDMTQFYILVDGDLPPSQVKKLGFDAGICGDCPAKKHCYVVLIHGPDAVFRAYKTGRCLPFDLNWLSGRGARIGAYGDPAAVPEFVWQSVKDHARFITGYSHFWNKFQWLNKFVQASVESFDFAEKAQAMGFKTFRTVSSTAELTEDEVICPNHINKYVQCRDCKLCNGQKVNVINPVHGSYKKHFPIAVVAA